MMGGTEVHVAQVGSRLAARGHDVTVFTTALGGEGEGRHRIDGMDIERLRAWPAKRDLYVTPALRKRVARGGFDLVHVQGYHTFVAPAAMSGAIAADVPFVVTFHSGGHSSRLRRSARPLQQRLLKPLLEQASMLIGVSDFEVRHFEQRLGLASSNFTTISNGVDDAFATAIPSGEEALVSSVGRLEEYKGHQHAIDAFARVADEMPHARLRIVGTGPLEATLRTMVRDRRVDDRVDFVSVAFGERREMAQILADSHVVVLASSYESQGIVGLEALASGAGLIVHDGSALADLEIYPGVDVVPRGDRAGLADSLRKQLATPRVPTRPSFPNWDGVADEVECVYRTVLGIKV